MASKLAYLNLGCGATFHTDWTNVDFVSSSEYVKQHNLLEGVPYEDNRFDVVYHSHVLEHFPKKNAHTFIKECYRVCKPGAIIRIAIPDLEQIALNYIKYLNESIAGVLGAEQKYAWTMLELFDQVVRSKTGGDMIAYIKDTSNNNDAFLLERNGQEVQRIMDMYRGHEVATSISYSFVDRFMEMPKRIRRKLIALLLGKEYAAYQIGKFRMEGEIHQWMYDRYSLKKMLEEAGFKNVQVKSKFESSIPDWETFNLDGKEGLLRKPDSLFVEAVK
ncbi:MAG: methyltransferase domain-containing protein [Bacteroidetes bacterium]|nr:methyltransferase domain-containing protein [Bacteroidota bacterium]